MAAVIALVQLDALKTGKPSPLAIAASASVALVETGVSTVTNLARAAGATIVDTPRLAALDGHLTRANLKLLAENARLREALAAAPAARALAEAAARERDGIAADVVGYDPENLSRSIALDRGSNAGVSLDDGVVGDGGVVGRVVAVTPFSSTVLLITDVGSNLPAVVQRGRYWGIAVGTNAHVKLQYVSQDARVRVGDRIVTGRGRSFRAGVPIGRILRIDRAEGGLYLSAILEPAVAFGRLERVVVVPRP